MKNIHIDCRIGMYPEDAVRVLATVDVQNDTVNISKLLAYRPPQDLFAGKTPQQIEKIKEIQKNSVVVVDNTAAFSNWDLNFIEQEHLDEAVRSYYLLNNNKSLVMDPSIAHLKLESVIEIRKMDLRGNVYELNSSEINNSYMAILVVCWAAIKIRNTNSLTSEVSPDAEDCDEFFTPFSV